MPATSRGRQTLPPAATGTNWNKRTRHGLEHEADDQQVRERQRCRRPARTHDITARPGQKQAGGHTEPRRRQEEAQRAPRSAVPVRRTGSDASTHARRQALRMRISRVPSAWTCSRPDCSRSGAGCRTRDAAGNTAAAVSSSSAGSSSSAAASVPAARAAPCSRPSISRVTRRPLAPEGPNRSTDRHRRACGRTSDRGCSPPSCCAAAS